MINILPVLAAAVLMTLPATTSLLAQAPPTGQTPAASTPVEIGRKTGEGEQCLVCGELIFGGGVVEFRYKGRRFFVSEALLDELSADPDRYFGKLQARSALFDEDAMPRATSRGWLYFGIYVSVGLLFSALCGAIAIGRSMPPLPWFFAGLIGNVAAFAVLMMTPHGPPKGAPAGIPAGLAKVPSTSTPVPCPACGAANHPSASECSGCAEKLEPQSTAEVAQWREAQN